jgi:hypothetical protein
MSSIRHAFGVEAYDWTVWLCAGAWDVLQLAVSRTDTNCSCSLQLTVLCTRYCY